MEEVKLRKTQQCIASYFAFKHCIHWSRAFIFCAAGLRCSIIKRKWRQHQGCEGNFLSPIRSCHLGSFHVTSHISHLYIIYFNIYYILRIFLECISSDQIYRAWFKIVKKLSCELGLTLMSGFENHMTPGSGLLAVRIAYSSDPRSRLRTFMKQNKQMPLFEQCLLGTSLDQSFTSSYSITPVPFQDFP